MSRYLGLRRCLAAGMLAMLASTTAWAQTPVSPWSDWLGALQSAGYGVAQGSALVNSASYCTQTLLPLFGSCFLNDPGDPYISPMMPVGTAYVDPYFGAVASQTQEDGTQVGQDFRLATTEAQLLIVTLPPQAAYFSYQTYLFSRPSSDYRTGTKKPSPDPSRGELFASLTNSINDIDIQAQSGLGFGQGTVAFISTGNAALAADMINQFVAVGGSASQIFVEPMGSNLGLGLGQASDDYVSLLRYLVPMDADAGSQWVQNVGANVLVYRIDQPASLAVTPYPPDTLLNKPTMTDETGYAGDVAELAKLLQGWLATQETKKSYAIKIAKGSETVSPQGVILKGSVGPFCIKNGSYCIADEQDTASYQTITVGEISANRMFIVAGVNHVATNDATLTSVSVINNPLNEGVFGVSQTNPAAAGFDNGGPITGSAELAMQTLGLWSQASAQLQQDAPYLYVQLFTRACTTQVYCGQTFTQLISSSLIPYSTPIAVMERAYVAPGYPNGANPDYLVSPQAIY